MLIPYSTVYCFDGNYSKSYVDEVENEIFICLLMLFAWTSINPVVSILYHLWIWRIGFR